VSILTLDVTAKNFAEERKKAANEYEWLYQCTSKQNFLNILKSREFWLSNLKDVNDKEEVSRIEIPEYENKIYVASFTYDEDISEEHWDEYSNHKLEDAVLFGVKKDWFIRKVTFMDAKNKKCDDIFSVIEVNRSVALAVKVEKQHLENIICHPYYIDHFGFYKVCYNDVLHMHVRQDVQIAGLKGCLDTTEALGIVKQTTGVCIRNGNEPYLKVWEDEKEVRLKTMIKNEDFEEPFSYFPKIAVPLSEDAFNVIKIRFSPKFTDKDEFFKAVMEILPECNIEIF